MYFDARAAKLLPPGNHIVVDGCLGLRLVSSSTGKAWIYRYQTSGKMRQIKIGQWPALPVGVAVSRWQELKDLRDAGQDPAQDKREKRQQAKASIFTVSDAVEAYVTGHLEISRDAANAKSTASRLRRAVTGIASLPASSVTRRIAWDLIAGLSDKPVMAKSVRNELGAAWDLALDGGKLPEDTPNWWRQILSGKLKSRGAVRDGIHKGTAKRTLSAEELRMLLTVDLKRFSQQVQDFLIIQLWTCTRGAEIVQMCRSHITQGPDGVWWTIPKELTKGKHNDNASALRVPLVGLALEVVNRLDGDYLFSSLSRAGVIGPQKQTYMQSKVNYLQPYCKSRPDHVRERLSVTHWSPHDLRRTGRTMLAQLGCPNEVAESILGHIRPGVQGVYDLYRYDAERRHWLTLWSNRLERIIAMGD